MTIGLESHRRAVEAIDAGRFTDEIAPINVNVDGGSGTAHLFSVDEGPRRGVRARPSPACGPRSVRTASTRLRTHRRSLTAPPRS